MTFTDTGWSTTFRMVLIVLASTALGSCGSGETSSRTIDVSSLAAKTTLFQREILQDGAVTRSEYEKAILAQRQCSERIGGIPGPVKEIGNHQLGYEVEFESSTEDELKKLQTANSQCHADFSKEVIEVWVYQQILSPQEIEKQLPAVTRCLKNQGVEIPSSTSREDILSLASHKDNIDAYLKCAEDFPGFFDTTDKK